MELISRDEAIDFFLAKGMITAAIYVERMPSAEKTGKWIDDKVAFYRVCSECGAVVRQDINEVYLLECMETVGALNYCPNCGSRMLDGVEE